MKKIIYPFFAAVLLFTASCKKEFFDINENPNSPTEQSITPKVLLPRALHNVGVRVGTTFDYAAFWMSYWGHSGSYGQSIEIESYAITTAFQSTQWTGWYDILNDINTMEKKAKQGGEPFYEGAAKTLKAIGYMYLVDQYNNVPYSKAFDFVGNITPAYDKGEDIYADLFVQLDAAGKLFVQAETNGIDASTKSADVMYGGNTAAWRRLVNTMRLKLLIHESQVVTAATRNTVVGQITADGAGYINQGSQAALVNPGYAVVDKQQNPFWNTYKITALGVTDQYNRANNYVLNKFTSTNDIRYQYVFSPAVTPLNGNTYKGVNFGEVVPNNDPYKQQNQSDVAGPGLAKLATQSQPVFTAIESLFLQAEAAERGWISGSAQTLYENAVKESFAYLGVGAGTGQAYLTAGAANPTIGYAAATNKIQLIVEQKYLGLIGLANFESYVDYRRLGFPNVPLSLNPNRLTNVIPLRLAYPQTEYNYNAANVAAQGTINPQTSAIFWDK